MVTLRQRQQLQPDRHGKVHHLVHDERNFQKKRVKSKRRNAPMLCFGTTILLCGAFHQYLGTVQRVLRESVANNDERSSSHNHVPVPKPPPPPPQEEIASLPALDTGTGEKYPYWRDIATKLAALPASEVVVQLESQDPFGTRRFEERLIIEESRLQRNLELDEIRQLFPCPTDRISLPDMRANEKAQAFRSGKKGTFLFFQHLRKAGGTHFCSLAEKNLPKRAIPRYYCMPDYDTDWSGGKGAGYLHRYPNEEIARHMEEKGVRVAGNEWDQFRLKKGDNHFDLPAVFATSFRKPLDRALSQFRFECLEGRGCHIKDIATWWQGRGDLFNVYTWTFSDQSGQLKKAYRGTNKQDIDKRVGMVATALDTVVKFNLVLAMEWLAYAGTPVNEILGFEKTEQLIRRVRPHINQAHRDDGQEDNKMGSASIAKASWNPKEYLKPEQYQIMSDSLALDEILTDAARRLFLERLVCPH